MTNTENPSAEDLEQQFSEIYYESFKDNSNIQQGVTNLQSLPNFESDFPAVPGKEFVKGVMGFRTKYQNLNLAIACGTAQVRYIDLAKFIAMVENLHDERSATIMLQNFTNSDDNKGAKGQILGRINAQSSAIHIIQGLTGRIIRNTLDIVSFDVYYIDRVQLTSFYLAAKSQISNADLLETMIATYDGWKAYDVPLNPLYPFGVA